MEMFRLEQMQILRANLSRIEPIFRRFGSKGIVNLVTVIELGCVNEGNNQLIKDGFVGLWLNELPKGVVDNLPMMAPDFRLAYEEKIRYISMQLDYRSPNKNFVDIICACKTGADVMKIPSMTPQEIDRVGYDDVKLKLAQSIESEQLMQAEFTDFYTCPNCASTRCIWFNCTTRSIDEGGTITVVCQVCSSRWNEGS